LPPEVYLESARVTHFNPEDQIEARELDTNLLEERRNTVLYNVRKYLTTRRQIFTRVAPRTKSKGLSIGDPLFNKKLMLFTRVAPHTKSKGPLIGGPLFSKKLILFTRVAPRTKSKGLPIGGPLSSKNLCFLHV
jgi:hypothetical protein